MTQQQQQPDLIQRVVGWLRAGYPEGVPSQDYVALLGILRRALTHSELDGIVRELSEDADAGRAIITPALVADRIEDVVKGPAIEADIGRVSARLASAGWPLRSPDLSSLRSDMDDEPAVR